MSVQFNRKVNILVGELGSQDGIGVTDLRVAFSVKKTGKKTTNKATVKIWNLSEESFSRLYDSAFKKILTIKAGYEGSDSLNQILYSGDVVDMSRQRDGADFVTVFDCSDGNNAINNTLESISYQAGTNARKILKDLVKKFPLANQYAVEVPNGEDVEYTQGFSFSGKIADTITELTEALGLEWSIQNNELKIIKKDGNDGTRAVNLNPNTGLISTPVRINDVSINGQKQKGLAGWKIESLLQPLIEPNGIITVQSSNIGFNTFFKVVSVAHEGDTHGNDWNSTAEVIENVA